MVMMVLVAGPYRSGTNDDPELIEANMRAMNEAALALVRAGCLGITGEAVALPLVKLAGSQAIGDAAWNEFMHPVGGMLAERCDAVLRIGGPSTGADEMVAIALANGKQVFYSVDEISLQSPAVDHDGTVAGSPKIGRPAGQPD
jgi:hypothetical protein